MASNPSNPPAPEELLEHVAFVRQLARGLVYGEDRVDEVVQQSFLRAIKSPPKHRGNLRSWFAVVVRNVVYRDASRARVREDAQWSVAQDAEAVEASDRAAERADFQRSISEAVHELAEPFRTVVVLRYFDELSIDEIAERLGVPRETVRSRQRRGLARLREQLARDDRRTGGDWRLSALAVLGEPAPVPELTLASSAGWLLPLAISLPLIAIGGAWWWMSASQDEDSGSNALTSQVTDDRSSAGTLGDEVAGNLARENLDAAGATNSAGRVSARLADLRDGEPLEDATLVVGVRTRDGWMLVELRSDATGACAGRLTQTGSLPIGMEFAEHAGADGERSFAVARAPGYAPLRLAPLPRASHSPEGTRWDLGDLLLEAGVPVRGVVTRHTDGSTVAGARLWLSDDRGESGNADRAVLVGQSDANGRFTLDELVAPNRFTPYTWTLFAEQAGRCGWSKLQLDALATEVDVAIELGPYAALDVEVLDEQGAPLAGALVRAVTFHAPWSKPDSPDELVPGAGGPLQRNFEARTDGRGRASFEALPARDDTLAALSASVETGVQQGGPYQLWIASPGRDVRFDEALSLPIGERSTRTVHLAGLAASAQPGRVLSAQDGRVLRDAWVRSPELGRQLAVDALGNFELPLDFPRRIEVGAPGHLARAFEWSESADTTRDCVLEPAFALSGLLLARDGSRVRNLLVRAEGGSQGGAWKTARLARVVEARSDEHGAFRLDGLSAGDWQVSVDLPPGSPWRPPETRIVEAGRDDLEIVLDTDARAGRDVRVRVVDAESGETLRALDAELSWMGEDAPPPPGVHWRADHIELAGVRPGDWRLWARVSGRGACLLDFTLEEGGSALELELPSSGLCRIEGRVELPADAGIPRDWIVASVFQGPGPPARWPGLRGEYGSRAMRSPVAEDGRFAMGTVVAGPYRLELIAPDWTASSRVLVEPGSTLTTRLHAERAGELLLRGPLPIPDGLSLWLSDGVGGEAWHWLRPELIGAGWEVRRPLPPGEQRWALAQRTPPGSARPLPPGPVLAEGVVVVESGVTHPVEVDWN